MSDLIVPDSIEPILGYKALRIDASGKFFSPSMQTEWPYKKPLEASCTAYAQHEWKWVATKGTVHPWCSPQQTGPAVTTTANLIVATTTITRPQIPPPLPKTELPPGMAWSWEPVPHNPVQNGCGCGIYAVIQPSACFGYATPDSAIVQVALWGRTIPASQGARAQYAYPQKIVSLAPLHVNDGRVQLAADNYGIPIEEEEFPQITQVSFTATGGAVGPTVPFSAGTAATPSTSASPGKSDLEDGEQVAFAILVSIIFACFVGLLLTEQWLAVVIAVVIGIAALIAGVGIGVITERQEP